MLWWSRMSQTDLHVESNPDLQNIWYLWALITKSSTSEPVLRKSHFSVPSTSSKHKLSLLLRHNRTLIAKNGSTCITLIPSQSGYVSFSIIMAITTFVIADTLTFIKYTHIHQLIDRPFNPQNFCVLIALCTLFKDLVVEKLYAVFSYFILISSDLF